MVRSIFFCTTRLQLYSASNIILQNNLLDQSLVIAVDLYKNCVDDCKRLSTLRISVELVSVRYDMMHKLLDLRSELLKIKRKYKMDCELFCTGAQNGFSVYGYYELYNGKAKIAFIDEGIYSYMDGFADKHPFSMYFQYNRFFALLFQRKKYVYEKDVYLMNPEMAFLSNDVHSHKIQTNSEVTSIFSRHEISPLYSSAQAIYFDQYGLDSEETQKYQSIIHMMDEVIDVPGMVVKMHPRNDYSNDFRVDNLSVIDRDFNLWEAELHAIDIRHKICITSSSSAAMIPGILDNVDYTLVLLYPIVIKKSRIEYMQMDRFTQLLKERRPSMRVIVLSSMDELKSYLYELRNTICLADRKQA